jgi:G3E family GTPase
VSFLSNAPLPLLKTWARISTQDVAALELNLDEPIEWAPFSRWLSLLLVSHGENILRFKALLAVTGSSGPVMLDGVHHLIRAPIHLPAWLDGPRASHIVIIAQGFRMQRIQSSLRDFLATHAARQEPALAVATSR